MFLKAVLPLELISATMRAPMDALVSLLTILTASRIAGPGIVTNVTKSAQDDTHPGPEEI